MLRLLILRFSICMLTQITETDKLPLQVCYQCASTLIAWHNLYEGCSVADKRLREILAVDEKLYHVSTVQVMI